MLQRRVGQTPYFMLSGTKPFGSDINVRRTSWIDVVQRGLLLDMTFVVFYPDASKVLKSRLVKLIRKRMNECDTTSTRCSGRELKLLKTRNDG